MRHRDNWPSVVKVRPCPWAAKLGWAAQEVFGLHPVAPVTRYDVMGLVWLLNGKEVSAIDERTAKTGTTMYYITGHSVLVGESHVQNFRSYASNGICHRARFSRG